MGTVTINTIRANLRSSDDIRLKIHIEQQEALSVQLVSKSNTKDHKWQDKIILDICDEDAVVFFDIYALRKQGYNWIIS